MDTNTTPQGEVVNDHYLRRSWAMLTAERGWFKPMLVMAAARFVPVVGWLGTEGYALEWGRLTAWRVDARPKQKNVQVGKVLSSGWRGFLVALGWNLCLAAVYWIVWSLCGGASGRMSRATEQVLGLVFVVLWLILSIVVSVAELRATIYQRWSTGYRFDRVFQMCRADFGGLMHMVGIELLGWLVKTLVVLVFVPITLGTVIPTALDYMLGQRYGSIYGLSSPLALHGLLNELSGLIPVLLIMLFLVFLVEVITTMVVTNGVALWMRRFDVRRWGKSSDPLPEVLPVASEGAVPPDGLGRNGDSAA